MLTTQLKVQTVRQLASGSPYEVTGGYDNILYANINTLFIDLTWIAIICISISDDLWNPCHDAMYQPIRQYADSRMVIL